MGNAGRAVALGFLLLALIVLIPRRVQSEEIAVPISLQVELLGRVLWYERALQRSADHALAILILTRAKNLESAQAAGQLEAQLARAKALGGKTPSTQRLVYQSAAHTRAALVKQQIYLLYLTPGLEEAVGPLAKELSGVSVLTVSALGGDVARGAVLGFELNSGKPQIALNLGRARTQKLDFSAQFLRIARVLL